MRRKYAATGTDSPALQTRSGSVPPAPISAATGAARSCRHRDFFAGCLCVRTFCTTPADESWRLKYAGVTEVKVFFRSVIQVEGPDTVAAIKRARDHTPGTVPLLLEVAVSMLLGCPLARDENVHVLKQSRPGAESYSLRLSDGRQFISARILQGTTPRRSASTTAIGTAKRSQCWHRIRTCGSSSAASLYRLERIVLAT
jgi:hypothetical protein